MSGQIPHHNYPTLRLHLSSSLFRRCCSQRRRTAERRKREIVFTAKRPAYSGILQVWKATHRKILLWNTEWRNSILPPVWKVRTAKKIFPNKLRWLYCLLFNRLGIRERHSSEVFPHRIWGRENKITVCGGALSKYIGRARGHAQRQ